MVLKGPRFRVSPVRSYVVVGSLVGAALLAVGAELVVGVSSSSGLVIMNGTLLIHRLDIGTCSPGSPPSASFCLCRTSFVAASMR